MSSEGLKRLKVWVSAKDLAVRICREVIPVLPSEEKYALIQQLRRSAQSIPANIAEGYGRFYFQDNIRFCYVARGSLEETISLLIIAHELGYLSQEAHRSLITESDLLVQLINGYIAYLKKTKQGEEKPGIAHTTHEATEQYQIEIDLADHNELIDN